MTFDNTNKQPSGDPTKSVDNLAYPNNTGEKWTDEWEYLTIGAKSSTSYGTGLSLTYRYKSNFSWRFYCDYDYTRKEFTAKYDPFHMMRTGLTGDGLGLQAREYRTKKSMNYWTLGLAFLVNF